MKYVASISYGKDSLAMLEIIKQNNLPLDRIITCDIWATPTIPAELPDQVEFKIKADKIIKERYGIEVEHVRAKKSFEEILYSTFQSGKNAGQIYCYSSRVYNWCNSRLKVIPVKNAVEKNDVIYVGLAADEESRVKRLPKNTKAPLYDFGITEERAMEICKELDLVNPSYEKYSRGGNCWFCYNQRVEELRDKWENYPEYFEMMKKWQNDSIDKRSFNKEHDLNDYEKRFIAEKEGRVPKDRRFRWDMLN